MPPYGVKECLLPKNGWFASVVLSRLGQGFCFLKKEGFFAGL